TNVISITDGQIYLTGDLFKSKVRPAIDGGISVSRVRRNAQIQAMTQVAGGLRLSLAQYRALAAFAQMGSELDKASMAQLTRGARMGEVLKQGQYSPLPVEKQVAIIYAGTNGVLDDLPLDQIRAFEQELYRFLENAHPAILTTTKEKKTIDDDLKGKLNSAIQEFKSRFVQDQTHKVAAT